MKRLLGGEAYCLTGYGIILRTINTAQNGKKYITISNPNKGGEVFKTGIAELRIIIYTLQHIE
ncbi:MAG: hypothetical protein LBK06_04030 [Planctomycetaceae bacterium]|nr:hypothetical protein [Planctomycetaceae bacterium]